MVVTLYSFYVPSNCCCLATYSYLPTLFYSTKDKGANGGNGTHPKTKRKDSRGRTFDPALTPPSRNLFPELLPSYKPLPNNLECFFYFHQILGHMQRRDVEKVAYCLPKLYIHFACPNTPNKLYILYTILP